MKAKRQAAILDIIRNQHIDTQEELTNALSAVGFAVTQATVSRDIKELRLIKTLSADGRYHYAAAAPIHTESSSAKLHTLFRDAVHSVDYACNIVVVKCMAGTAGAVPHPAAPRHDRSYGQMETGQAADPGQLRRAGADAQTAVGL